MSDQKKEREYKKAIVFDMDGVLNHLHELKTTDQPLTQGKVTLQRSNFSIQDEYIKGYSVNIVPVRLLKWFFEALHRKNIKVILGTQRLLALTDKPSFSTKFKDSILNNQNAHTTVENYKQVESLLKALDQIFGEKRTFLSNLDIKNTIRYVKREQRNNSSDAKALANNHTKKIYLDYTKEHYRCNEKNICLVDDTPDLTKAAKDAGYDTLYAYKGEERDKDPIPLFIVDILFKEFTVEEILAERERLETPLDKQNFDNLLNIYAAATEATPEDPRSATKAGPKVITGYEALISLLKTQKENLEKIQQLQSLIKENAKTNTLSEKEVDAFLENPHPMADKDLTDFLRQADNLDELAKSDLRKPENIILKVISNLLLLVVSPKRLINKYPEYGTKFEVGVRVINSLIIIAIVMFAFPSLGAALAGAFGGSAAFSAFFASLPVEFMTKGIIGSGEIFFGIAGALMAAAFQFFNKMGSGPVLAEKTRFKATTDGVDVAETSVTSESTQARTNSLTADSKSNPQDEHSVSGTQTSQTGSRRPSLSILVPPPSVSSPVSSTATTEAEPVTPVVSPAPLTPAYGSGSLQQLQSPSPKARDEKTEEFAQGPSITPISIEGTSQKPLESPSNTAGRSSFSYGSQGDGGTLSQAATVVKPVVGDRPTPKVVEVEEVRLDT